MSDEPRKSHSWPWRSATLLLLLAYVGGYFVLNDNWTRDNWSASKRVLRTFPSSIVAPPTLRLECWNQSCSDAPWNCITPAMASMALAC
ncbi:MAG TPA: hypothetical protein VFG04_23775 [Planctomycetaceae bacterium]|nr:hypothetical protein [Planctomycetaceae bacterium]